MNEEEEEEEQGGSLANGAADLLSEIRYSSLSIISYLFGEGYTNGSIAIQAREASFFLGPKIELSLFKGFDLIRPPLDDLLTPCG